MRDAVTVLEIIRERGRKGLPLERVYRCLFNPDLFLLAYGKLYRNTGAMTPGITRETVDGMSLDKIETIITVLRQERYRWTPVRRTYIDKKGTRKKRPLGLPTWSDKLVQEVIRLVLEAYYEPRFSDRSHGFRPGPRPALLLFPWVGSGALRRVRGRSSQVKGAWRRRCREGACAPPWTCEPLRPLRAGLAGRPGACPSGCAAPPNLARTGGRR